MWRRRRSNVLADAVKGGLAGLCAGWLMNAVSSVIYDRQDPVARSREEDARGGKIASEVAVQKAARLLGRKLDDQAARRWGPVVHEGLAIGAGALYGVARGRLPSLRVGVGLLFGLTFFVVADELALTALRIASSPLAFPWQTHARGLAGHLAYGVATEAQLRVLEGAARL
jgi:hypothetical protein